MIQHSLISAVIFSLLTGGALAPAEADEEPATVLLAPSSVAPGDGLPYGPFVAAFDRIDPSFSFTGGWIPMSPSYANNTLRLAQEAGASVAVRLSGGGPYIGNPDGTFNLELWKDRIDNWEGTNIDEFINDGTILVHYLIDEPKCVSCWGGEVVTNDILDEMAAYSKARWPNMATAVRESPTRLAEKAGGYDVAWPDWEWTYLDTAWAQYSAYKGDVVEHAIAENTAAIEQGLGLVAGLSVLHGGDGSSGLSHPERPDRWTMSVSEINTYTRALIDNTEACAFVMYRYDDEDFTYFGRSDISQTIDQMADYAAASPRSPCVRMDSAGPRFYDLVGSVFTDDILWLANQGITAGCNPPANDRFCPDDVVTRAQMASFLTRALGLTTGADTDLFRDDDNSDHEDNINRLGAAGIAFGCNPPVNDRFCPDVAVTRGQMAAFLVRALGLAYDGGGNDFIDDDGSVFEDDIAKIAAAGITLGCNPPANDRFCPGSTVTRGQMAAFLHRALS